MVEILQSFERTAGRFSPVVLIVPGLVMVVLGLLAWLAGSCLRRVVLGVVGAAAGLLVGFLVIGPNPPAYALAAGGGAAFGAILPRVFLAGILAVFGAAIAFAIVARAHLVEEQGTRFGAPDGGPAEGRFTVQQSLDAARACVIDVRDRAEAAAHELTPVDWAIVAAAILAALVLAAFSARLAGALACSALGTMLILTGLTLLLILKGSAPIARIEQQGAFYGLVLLGMAAFGTLEQLVLCKPPKREAKAGAGKSKSQQREEPKRGWRSR